MTRSSKYVGLDVHQATTIAAVGAAKAPKPTAPVPAGKYGQLAGVDGAGSAMVRRSCYAPRRHATDAP